MTSQGQGPPSAGAERIDVGSLAEAAGTAGPNGLLEAVAPGLGVHRSGLSYYGAGVRSWDGKVHRHPHRELFICLSGSGWLEVEGERLPMEPATAYMVAEDAEHHQIAGPGGMGTAWWLLEPVGAGS